MNEPAFVAQREAAWQRFDMQTQTIAKLGPRAVPTTVLFEFVSTYRAINADLSTARSRKYSLRLISRLNQLAGNGRATLYTQNRQGGGARIGTFFVQTFPQALRAASAEMLAATVLFVLGAVIAAWFTARDPGSAYVFMHTADALAPIKRDLHDTNFGFDRAYSSSVAVQIITNNIGVAAMAFAGGLTAGILTVYALITNGFMVGTSLVLYAQSRLGYDFIATIAPHGVIELTAITISGGAGLHIARAIVAPGRLRRSDAIAVAARRSGVLIVGVFMLLVIAGTIEGFISPLRISTTVRVGIGIATGIPLYFYLFFVRPKQPG